MIIQILIALFSILVVFYCGYVLIKRLDNHDSNIFDIIILQCNNCACEKNGCKEYNYNISKDRLIEILHCSACGKTRQIIKDENNDKND